MLKSLATVTFAAALAMGGCMQNAAAPTAIDKAIPTSDQVSIKLPTAATAKDNKVVDHQVGDLASWYVATRGVTATFNGGSAWVLILVHTIVAFPVTSIDGDTYTWGPWSGNALDPASYKLDVTALGDGTFNYTLSGQSKTQTGASFMPIITGHADPGADEATGNGTFNIDFNAARAVDPIDNANNSGTVAATYDLAAKHLELDIANTSAAGTPETATYIYDETADGGGDMSFQIFGDGSTAKSGENALLRSRWLSTGAGRADGEVTAGDIGSVVVTLSQCWDTQFDETYYEDSVGFLPTDGDPTTCAFADQDLPPQS